MSQENREVVRRNNDAYNRRDLRAYLETVSESVGFRSRFSAMDNRGYEGHEDLRRYFAEVDEAWRWYEMNLERLVDAGARVVDLFHLQSHWP
jgi:ketosteroid isomerase-like protein